MPVLGVHIDLFKSRVVLKFSSGGGEGKKEEN
jgi:hypothetical protein